MTCVSLRIARSLLLWAFAANQVVFASPPDCSGGADDAILLSFAHLGYFSDRGVAISPFSTMIADQTEDTELSVVCKSLPDDLRQQLQTETPRNFPKLPDWPWLRGSGEGTSRDLEAMVSRIARMGLIELLRPEYSGLFETPLVSRETLMKEITRLVEEARAGHATLFAEKEAVVNRLPAAGALRKLSVDVDITLLSHLSETERTRLTAFISRLMPYAVNFANTHQQLNVLGSENLGRRGREE